MEFTFSDTIDIYHEFSYKRHTIISLWMQGALWDEANIGT